MLNFKIDSLQREYFKDEPLRIPLRVERFSEDVSFVCVTA